MKERDYNKYFETPYILGYMLTIYISQSAIPLMLKWLNYGKSKSIIIKILEIPVDLAFELLLIGTILVVSVFIFNMLYLIGKKAIEFIRKMFCKALS